MNLAIVLFLAFFNFVFAQNDSQFYNLIIKGKDLVKDGYATFNKALLMEARSLFERAVSIKPESPLAFYHLAYSEYCLLIYALNFDDELFNKLIDIAIRHAEESMNLNDKWSEPPALLSSLYGLKIAKNWIQGPFLGPKSSRLIEVAIILDSLNPRAWLVRGISKFNTPSIFGGDIDEAIENLKRAIDLFERNNIADPLGPDWGYIDALVWLGKCYERKKQFEKAAEFYKRALEVEPRFGWAKRELSKLTGKTK